MEVTKIYSHKAVSLVRHIHIPRNDVFIKEYNQRKHQGIDRQKPIKLFADQIKNKLKSA